MTRLYWTGTTIEQTWLDRLLMRFGLARLSILSLYIVAYTKVR